MKKVLAILLVYSILMTLLVVSPFTASADEKGIAETGAASGKTGGCTWTLDNNGVLTISGDGKIGDYSYIYKNGSHVTTAPWLSWGNNVRSVVIENGVKSIGNYAFYGCNMLTSVTIPASVTNIGVSVFSDCAALTSVKVAEGNTVFDSRDNCNAIIEKESNNLIYGCTTTIIPDSVTSIGYAAFYGSGLASIDIPDSVTSIGDWVFNRCTGLTSVTIPNSVTSIGDWAFNGCTGLTSVTIPDSVTSIGESAFSGCTNLKTVQLNQTAVNSFKSSFTASISSTALMRNIENIVISDSVIGIGSETFSDCAELKSVDLGNSVEAIGEKAFYDNTELMSVTIPKSVTVIQDKAFGYYNLTGVGDWKIRDFTIYGYTGSEAERYAKDNGFEFISLDEATQATEPTEKARPAAPKPTLTDTAEGVLVTWDGIEGIEQYRVYHLDENGKIIKTLATINDTSFLDIRAAAGETYNYSIGYYWAESNGFWRGTGDRCVSHTYNPPESPTQQPTQAPSDAPFDPTKTTDRDIFGDIDGDGVITIVDTTFLQRYTIRAVTPYPIGEKMK